MYNIFRKRHSVAVLVSSGFTLVELLFVIAIIGVLAGLLGTAILQANKTATKVRSENNAEVLRSAIVEYWHDFNKWPVDAKILKEKISKIEKQQGSGATVAGSDKASGRRNYSVSFYEDNNEVVKNLLDVKAPGGARKTYLDLKGFVTPTETGLSAKDYPTTDTVDAYQAYSGTALSDDINASERQVTKRTEPVLLFLTSINKCPHCGALAAGKTCPNKTDDYAKSHDLGSACSFYESNEYPYVFRRRDRVEGAKPYTIKFDFNDNTVSVETN